MPQRSASKTSAQSHIVMPRVEETKFLAMPIIAHNRNREQRALSAKKAVRSDYDDGLQFNKSSSTMSTKLGTMSAKSDKEG